MYLGMTEEYANAVGWRGTDEGGKLKDTTTHWNSPNEGVTNESGFTALPGGLSYDGSFLDIGNYGDWWSATESNDGYACIRVMYYNDSRVNRGYSDTKSAGYSVRCVKD